MNTEKNFNAGTNDLKDAISDRNAPLVTIGITNYNGLEFLDQCIDSILTQSIKALEIIIVDDSSEDGSIERIKSLENLHGNIRAVFHEQNSGSPDLGREEILNASNGKYIMLFDSDDYFADTHGVEKLLNEFEKYSELDYVYCNMLVVNREGKNTGLWSYRQYNDNELIRDTFQRGGSGVIPMKGMFKKSFFTKNKLSWYSNETAGDTLSALIYTRHGWKYRHLDLNLLCYRQYGESFTFNLEKRIKSILKILDYIVDNYNEEVYLPGIPWKELGELTRYNIKNYLLGQFYFELLKVYYSEWPSLIGDRKQLLEALIPLKNKALFYLKKWKEYHPIFDSVLGNMLKEITAMFEM